MKSAHKAFAPLGHRDYSLLIGGRIVSLIGSQMQMVALSWQVYVLTHDPLALGAIGLARIFPLVLVALFGGVLADASDRRRLLIVTALIGGANSAVLALATSSEAVSLPLLYSCAAIGGGLAAVDNPARQALLPSLVPRELLGQALSLGTTAYHVAAVIGPMAGGIVLDRTGAATVYTIDAASYLAIVGGLFAMRFRPTTAREVTMGFGAIREGIEFIWRTPILRSTMFIDFFATLLAGATQLMPIFARELFHAGPSALGLLLAAPSAGSAAMGVALALRPPPKAQGRAILGAIAIYGLAMGGFGLTASLPLGLALLAVSGAADTVSAVLRQVLRQISTPDALRGRMTSISMIFFVGGPQLGEVEAGVVARLAGVRASVISGGVGCFLLALGYAWRAPWFRRYRHV